MTRRIWFLAAIAVLAVVSSCGGSSRHQLSGQVRTPLPEVGMLSLPDPSGAPFVFKARDRSLLLVYFGYTSCPDVCPTTLSDVRTALRGLGGRSAEVALAMITVDPERDTPSLLSEYVRSFDPDAIALATSDDRALHRVGDAFGATFGVEHSAGSAGTVTHSAFLYAVDDHGRIRVQWPFGVHAPQLAGDLRWMLDHPLAS